MKQDAGYVIGFSGLANGNYTFHFPIRDSFFAALEFSEVRKGNLEADVTLERETHALLLGFHIRGTVHVLCDHCAEYFDLQVEGRPRLIVKLGTSYHEENEEEITVPEQEGEINLHQYLYEFIALMIPYRRIHPGPDEETPSCINEALDRLTPPEEKEEKGDPRWDQLKKLKF